MAKEAEQPVAAILPPAFPRSILAVMRHDACKGINTYTKFSGIAEHTVRPLFPIPAPHHRYLNHRQFRQILCIHLSKLGEKEVHKAIVQLKMRGDIEYASPSYPAQAAALPYAERYGQYYALDRIQAPQAWAMTGGSENVRVGVIDSGIFPHRDLQANTARGWDFVHRNANTQDDTLGHGTHIAGIIGGAWAQDGVAGVCRAVQMIPLQVLDDQGWFDRAAVIEAIAYAAENNIPILNYCDSSDTRDYALEAAIRNYTGLFVCSAGNNGRNIDEVRRYPPSLHLPNVLCVAASGREDTLCAASNYGDRTVHLAAPGEAVYTTAPSHHPHEAYRFHSGTSIATPYVTGVAALIKSIAPFCTTNCIKCVIISSTDKIPGLSGKVSSGGRLNAYRAVRAVYHRP